jgi:hypothetical protein
MLGRVRVGGARALEAFRVQVMSDLQIGRPRRLASALGSDGVGL